MNEIIKELFSGNFFTMLAIMTATAALMNLFFKFLRTGKEKIKGPEKFYKLLDKKFDLGLITGRADIIVLRDSIAREEYSSYGLAPLLEDYLKYMVSTHSLDSDDKNIKDKYEIVMKIIEEENEEKPFSDIPEEERRLLRSLKDAVVHNDLQSVQFNIDELGTVISARSQIYLKANKINRWALPFAILGLITTIIFGIMSIRKSIDYEKIDNILNNKTKIQQMETGK